ncbi:hypothetical protein [Mesorhizobium sp. M0159]|uniref:hypothetical protein n=1 Tax=Mesorhizobium sp. M0159 TaxID=2956900 RepID=UPI003337A340
MTPTHPEDLGRARTAADFAAIRALLDTDLNNAIARKAELETEKFHAIFGAGNLTAARAALDDCNAEIALIEKTIEDADERRVGAPWTNPPPKLPSPRLRPATKSGQRPRRSASAGARSTG